jgi:ABC-type transport system involved in cytochrome c biogenesis permease subunit
MSTTELPRYESIPQGASARRDATVREHSAFQSLALILAPLASLRLTVALLGLSIFLVLAGTLAQVDYDILHVLHNYFRAWIAWIELRIFFPRAWGISSSAVFPFPGGKLLGVALATNLVAAHALRFKVAAHGRRLWLGWLTIAVGAAITYAVIVSGNDIAVESEMSASFANGLWHALRAAVGASALTLTYVLALTRATAKKSAAWWLWWFGAVTAAIVAGVAIYLFTNPAARLNASGLRILWQLAKATGASVILGAGCWAVFSKRAGIVLLHSGIGLMMFTELYTAQNVVEARMTIDEGETAHYADDIRLSELALVTSGDSETDRTVVIPESMLLRAAKSKEVISDDRLPVDVRVVEFLPNASWRRLQPGEQGVATAGLGQLDVLEPIASGTGVEVEQTVDLPGAYVELLSKEDGKSLGTYLTRLTTRRGLADGDPIEVDGKVYNLALRFKRVPKPYAVTLLDFEFKRYIGTMKPKDFRSNVRFQDPSHDVDRTVSIWMNNPLRYGGDTLYQASYDETTERTTVLQVMTNAGWMVPYVACMIVAAGMLIHFTQAIVRFVFRREDEAKRQALGLINSERAGSSPSRTPASWRSPEYWVPAFVVLLALVATLRFASPPKDPQLDFKIHDFGRLPVARGGRTQPMDSVAQNALRIVSGKATYEDERSEKRQPAIRWLLDVIAQAPEFREHRVVRVENLDVLQALGLPHRPLKWRYSIDEISEMPSKEPMFKANGDPITTEVERQIELARGVAEDKRDLTQRKFLELDAKLSTIIGLRLAFDLGTFGEGGERLINDPQSLERLIASLNDNPSTPRAVPPMRADGPWQTVLESAFDMLQEVTTTQREPQGFEPTRQLLKILSAYRDDNASVFNSEIANYQTLIEKIAAQEQAHEASLVAAGAESDRKSAERLILPRVRFESFYNHFDPFVVCIPLYVLAFILAALAWVGWPRVFNRSANWLLWFTFALHTFALICRVYISGRPPVTNLYSSAVFIGWAGVLMALCFEVIYKLGVGNLLAAIIGFPTMIIAYQLTFDQDGDTLGVMQAVLDTNFWLATHVVCITLGYATSLGAGLLGLLYVVLGDVAGVIDRDVRKQLSRMIYGSLCFAIFFSFIGTVLGGLWADDSWGRFWGWDPKENGALMIVLWNALVLHARWGKMVGERGLACLTVIGNIVVAWSWWGVNQLGVGLHSYGEVDGITFWLTTFALSQLAVVAVAYAMPFLRPPSPRAAV